MKAEAEDVQLKQNTAKNVARKRKAEMIYKYRRKGANSFGRGLHGLCSRHRRVPERATAFALLYDCRGGGISSSLQSCQTLDQQR